MPTLVIHIDKQELATLDHDLHLANRVLTELVGAGACGGAFWPRPKPGGQVNISSDANGALIVSASWPDVVEPVSVLDEPLSVLD